MRTAYWMLGVTLGLLLAGGVRAQNVDLSFLQTRAEATGFVETTRYDELMGFLDVLARTSPRLHLTTFGYTTEGRALPLMIYGDLPAFEPEAIRRSDKARVFVMANIHAGEVCGKEAMLILLRALAAGRHAAWADSLIVLVAPIYNADGNERISLYNRPRQHGPIGGMGQRPNAQGLDLNRDFTKLDSPEARSLVGLLNAYDPHVVVDLHTTNGTLHAYHLTYAEPLHPGTDEHIVGLLRNVWLPEVTDIIRQKYGWEFFFYGNLPWPGSEAGRGWYTYDHRPRFSTNYVGLRNRLGILSEAYAYATFEERVMATLRFVEEILHFAHANASTIRSVVAAADRAPVVGRPLALTARPVPAPEPVEILLGEVVEEKHPYTGAVMLRRTDARRPERMPVYGTFEPVLTETAPRAYLVPPELAVVRDRLEAHGVRFRVLSADTVAVVERFRIDSTHVADRAYQQHHLRTLFGSYERAEVTVVRGTLYVPVNQPLGRLLFILLEPRSDDGLTTWGLLDEALEGASYFPITRLPAGG